MGLSSHAKSALRTSLGIAASTEVIPLLDLIADEVKRRKEAENSEPPVQAPPASPPPEEPPAEQTEEAESFDGPSA